MMFINGEWRDALGGRTFEVTNPATGEVIRTVPDGGRDDALAAIDAADQAFAGWAGRTAFERSEILHKAYGIMVERKEELAHTMTTEQGKPLRASRIEVQYAADFLRWFAEEAKRVTGQVLPAPRKDQRFIVLRQPVGVVGAVTPWNYPISMLTRKMGPALAAGCTVVLKPAEATPLTAIETYKVFTDAGVPPGVINLVTALDPAPIGDLFVTDKRVRKLTFTGSTAVGRKLAGGAGENMKRISLELGGHAPFIVFKDADPVHAAKGAAAVKFLNTGQACISPNRMFVHKDAIGPFTEELVSRVTRMRAGNGLEDGIGIGPLVNEAAIEKVDRQVRDATAKGAALLCGGHRMMDNGLDRGTFYSPTVLSNVTEDMLIYREETFGPVAAVIPYDDDDDIMAMANDTQYGLASYIYTNNIATAMRAFEALNFGIVGINDINPTAAAAPFGGIKDSGLGREGGAEGIDEYLDVKLVDSQSEPSRGEPRMPLSVEEADRIMRRMGKALFNKDRALLEEAFTEDAEWHFAIGEDPPHGRVRVGVDGILQGIADNDSLFSRLRFTEIEYAPFGESQIVMTYLLDGQRRDGDEFNLRGIEVISTRDGRVTRKDVFWKQYGAGGG